jgi:hypothetical protein
MKTLQRARVKRKERRVERERRAGASSRDEKAGCGGVHVRILEATKGVRVR